MSDETKLTREIVLETLGDMATPCSKEHAQKVRAAVSQLYDTTETLRAEVERLQRTSEYWKAEHLAGNDEIERLRAELDAAKRDAERYRWLRDADVDIDDTMRALFGDLLKDPDGLFIGHSESLLSLTALDAAIDAALARERP